MKNKPVLIFTTLVILYIGFFIFIKKNEGLYTQQVGSSNYKLLVADTPEEHEKGLMHVRKLENADGMIFLFDDYKRRTFWNQNTYVDLDVFWFKDNILIKSDYMPSITKTKIPMTVTSPEDVNKVVEIIRN